MHTMNECSSSDESYFVSFLSRSAGRSRTSPVSLWMKRKSSAFLTLLLKPLDRNWDLISAPSNIYLWSRLSRWPSWTGCSRTTGITLTIRNNHTERQSGSGEPLISEPMDFVTGENPLPSLRLLQEDHVHRRLQGDHRDPSKHHEHTLCNEH